MPTQTSYLGTDIADDGCTGSETLEKANVSVSLEYTCKWFTCIAYAYSSHTCLYKNKGICWTSFVLSSFNKHVGCILIWSSMYIWCTLNPPFLFFISSSGVYLSMFGGTVNKVGDESDLDEETQDRVRREMKRFISELDVNKDKVRLPWQWICRPLKTQ